MNRHAKAALLVVFGSVVGVGAVLVAKKSKSGDRAPSERELAGLRGELDALKKEVSRERQRTSWLALSGNGAAQDGEPERAQDRPPASSRSIKHDEPAVSDAEIERRVGVRFAALDARLRSETRDAGWARETEARLTGALASAELSKYRVESLSCATTMCKLDTLAANDEEADQLLKDLPSQIAFMGSGVLHKAPLGDGRMRVTTFLGRPGQPLPDTPAE